MKQVKSFALLAYSAVSRYPVLQPITIAESLIPQMTTTLTEGQQQTWTCPYSSYKPIKIRLLFTDSSKTDVCGLRLVFEINHIQKNAAQKAEGWPDQSNHFGCPDSDTTSSENVQTLSLPLAGDYIISIIAYRDAAQTGKLTGLKINTRKQGDVMLGVTGVDVTTWNLNGRRFIGATVTIIGSDPTTYRIAALTPSVVSFDGDCNNQTWLPSKQSELTESQTTPIEVEINSPGYRIELLPQLAQTIKHCQLEVSTTSGTQNDIYVFSDGRTYYYIRRSDPKQDGQVVTYGISVRNQDSLGEFKPDIITGKNLF